MDCSPPGSSVQGIVQARILEWVALSCSRGSPRPGDGTRSSCSVSCTADGFPIAEPPGYDSIISLCWEDMRWNAQWSPPELVDEGELQPSGQWRPAEAVRTRAWLSRHGRRSRDPRSQERAEVLPDGQLPARGTAGRCHPAPGPRHQALRSDPPDGLLQRGHAV